MAWTVTALVAALLPVAMVALPQALPHFLASPLTSAVTAVVPALAWSALFAPAVAAVAAVLLFRGTGSRSVLPLGVAAGGGALMEALSATGLGWSGPRVVEAMFICAAPLILGLRKRERSTDRRILVGTAAALLLTGLLLEPALLGRVSWLDGIVPDTWPAHRANLIALELLLFAGLVVMPRYAARHESLAVIAFWTALIPQAVAQIHLLAGPDLGGLAALDAARTLKGVAGWILLAGIGAQGLHAYRALRTALERSERANERTDAILGAVADGIVLVDERNRIQSLNQAAEQLFACRTTDLLGHDISKLITSIAQDPPGELGGLGDLTRLEETGRRRNGTTFPLSIVVSDVVHAGRKLTAWVLSDLTPLKRAQEERDRFFSLSPIAMFVATLDGRFTRINRSYREALELPERELLGHSMFEFVHPDDRQATVQMMSDLGKGRPIFNFENRHARENGSSCWFSWSVGAAVQDGLLYAVGLDVTDRKRKAQELHSSWKYARDLFEVNPNPIVVITNEGAITDLNREAVELFGSRAECVGRPLPLNFADPMATANALQRVHEEGQIDHCALELWNADGELRQITLSACEYRSEAGDVLGVLAVLQDVTKERQLEAHLFQSQKLESIGQLAAGIAHEINTPTQYVMDNVRFLADAFGDLGHLVDDLRKVLGEAAADELSAALQELRKDTEEADTDFLLEEIPRAIDQSCEGLDRVAKIVRAMKEFSHPGRVEKSTVDLNHAIENTVTVARNEWKYVADLELDLDPDLPPVPCLESELNQVVLNLLVNAAHAIEENREAQSDHRGRIAVRTRRDGEWAEVQIEDSGAGIPQEIQSKVFDLFFTTKEVGKGTGQGLALAHSVVVEKHKGRLSFETEVGRGTTFFIRLPLEAKAGVTT